MCTREAYVDRPFPKGTFDDQRHEGYPEGVYVTKTLRGRGRRVDGLTLSKRSKNQGDTPLKRLWDGRRESFESKVQGLNEGKVVCGTTSQ